MMGSRRAFVRQTLAIAVTTKASGLTLGTIAWSSARTKPRRGAPSRAPYTPEQPILLARPRCHDRLGVRKILGIGSLELAFLPVDTIRQSWRMPPLKSRSWCDIPEVRPTLRRREVDSKFRFRDARSRRRGP